MNELQYCLDLMPNTVQGFDFHFNQTPHNKSQHSIHFNNVFRHRKTAFFHAASHSISLTLTPLTEGCANHSFTWCHWHQFFFFCLFTSSSVGLSCLLFPLNFRQPPPTYFIANKILYQSKRVACIKNRHEWKKTRPLYPRKYIKCPESFQSYQMHRTNFKICSQNNKTAMYFLNISSSSSLFWTNNSFVSRQTNTLSFHRCQSNDMREPFLS